VTSDAAGEQPAKLGHYELLDRLGAGGMGVVYRARDERYGNIVALKVIHPHLQSAPGYIDRFRREAHIASMLTSPFVVKTLEFGQDQGQYFLATEFVEGEALSARIKRAPLSDAEATRVITEVALALDSAHGRGIVHRDLKPENIMIASDGSTRLMDFGLSHLSYLQGVTATGFYSGSAAYSAPEQFEAQGDARSDIYSAGAVLFEMLAGRAPFDAPSLIGMMRQHQNEAPPFDLIANRPDALKAVVARCLAKDPAWRFQDAAQMLQALQGATARRTIPSNEQQTTVLDRRASDPPTRVSAAPSQAEGTVLLPRAPSQPPPPPAAKPAPAPQYSTTAPARAPARSNTALFVGIAAAIGIVVGIAVLLLNAGGDGNSGAGPSSSSFVRTTPTAAQRYPAALDKEYMDGCTGGGGSQALCRCMLDILQTHYDEKAYRELERAVARKERQNEIDGIARACS
jgi:serine/threonine-protein kinase